MKARPHSNRSMPAPRSTPHWPTSAPRCAETSFGDGQRLDKEADRPVRIVGRRPFEADVGDDLTGNRKFRVGQIHRQPLGQFPGARSWQAKFHLMPFTYESKRLPINRLEMG